MEKLHQKLARIAESWPEDSFHSHQEIAAILEISKDDSRYHSTISQARKILLRKRILWKVVKDGGYRVCLPDEWAAAVRGGIMGAARRMRMAENIDNAAPVERMSEEGKRRHTNLSDRLRVHAAMMGGVVKEIRMLADPKIKLTR